MLKFYEVDVSSESRPIWHAASMSTEIGGADLPQHHFATNPLYVDM